MRRSSGKPRRGGGGGTRFAARAARAEAGGRERLTRDRVIAGALALLDREGLEGLTMRALGRELGVDPMAAYHWFPDKRAILQAIAEAMLLEIPATILEPGARWDRLGLNMARAYRETLLRHPHALPIVATQPVMTPRGLERVEQLSAAIAAGGLTPGGAMKLVNILAAYVIGAALAEVGVTPGSEALSMEELERFYTGLDSAQFPTLTASMAENPEEMGDLSGRFELALGALIRGLEASFRDRGLVR